MDTQQYILVSFMLYIFYAIVTSKAEASVDKAMKAGFSFLVFAGIIACIFKFTG